MARRFTSTPPRLPSGDPKSSSGRSQVQMFGGLAHRSEPAVTAEAQFAAARVVGARAGDDPPAGRDHRDLDREGSFRKAAQVDGSRELPRTASRRLDLAVVEKHDRKDVADVRIPADVDREVPFR